MSPGAPELADPLEVGHVAHVLVHQRVRDVARVHLHHDERAQHLALEERQLALHQRAQRVQLRGRHHVSTGPDTNKQVHGAIMSGGTNFDDVS